MNKGCEDLIFKFADELRVSEKLGEVMKGSTITESFGSGIYEMAQQAFDNFQQQIEAIIYYDGYEILSITGTKNAIDFIRWIMERNEEGSSDKIKFTYDEYETALNITFRPIDTQVNPVVKQRKLEGAGLAQVALIAAKQEGTK